MILDETIEIKCSYQVKEYYNKLGYNVKNGERFIVKTEDISKGSNKKINVKCDYCGKEKVIMFETYVNNTKNFTEKYACSSKCAWIDKNRKTNLNKYGFESSMQNKDIFEKVKNTCLNKYGVDNISKTEEFKVKYKEKMNENYGVDNGFQSEDIKQKIKEASMERYGYEHYRQNEDNKLKYCKGENSNFYIDGRSYNEDSICENNERNKWREEVYKRDNYTCQCCGDNKGGNLNAHHLDGYNWCNMKRFLIENGVTLCEDCHKNFHITYKYGNNTKEQFQEWILKVKCNDYPIRE